MALLTTFGSSPGKDLSQNGYGLLARAAGRVVGDHVEQDASQLQLLQQMQRLYLH